jgi:aspartyl-tRNA(Asn)/glutamyl-tRNA(Gln) amidotransferase subunit A
VEDCVVLVSATQGVDRLDAATLPRDPRIDALAEEIFFDRAHRDADDDADDAAADGKPDWNPETSFTKGSRRDARARGYLKSKPGYPLWGWRVGVPAEFFISELSEEVKEAWIMTGKVCESLGARLVPMNLPGVKHALAAYYVLAPAEASSNLARYDGVRFGVTGTDAGLGTTGTHGDLGSSPFHAAAAASRLDGFGTEVRRRVLAGTFVSSAERASRYVEKARKVRRALSDDFSRAFQEVDILLTPTTPTVAPPSFAPEHRSDATRSADSPTASAVFGYAADCMTVPASLAGLPAVSLPVGLGSASGLPVGMQIIAARGGDADVLGFALSLEKAIEKLGEKGGGAGRGRAWRSETAASPRDRKRE